MRDYILILIIVNSSMAMIMKSLMLMTMNSLMTMTVNSFYDDDDESVFDDIEILILIFTGWSNSECITL